VIGEARAGVEAKDRDRPKDRQINLPIWLWRSNYNIKKIYWLEETQISNYACK